VAYDVGTGEADLGVGLENAERGRGRSDVGVDDIERVADDGAHRRRDQRRNQHARDSVVLKRSQENYNINKNISENNNNNNIILNDNKKFKIR